MRSKLCSIRSGRRMARRRPYQQRRRAVPQPAIDFAVKGWNAVINTNLNGT